MTGKHTLIITILLVAGVAAFGVHHGIERFRASHPGLVDVQTAWSAVRAEPRDPVRWATLADAQAAIDQAEAAEQSYLTAVRLGSRDPTVHGRLGFLLYGHGRDQEALSALREAKDLGAELPLLAQTLTDLEARLAPPEPPPEPPAAEEPAPAVEEYAEAPVSASSNDNSDSACTVAAPRQGRMGPFIVMTKLEGVEAPLVVDTGASLTTLSFDLLEDLQVTIDEEHTVDAITATGPAVFPTARLSAVEIGGRRVENLTVAACDACGGRVARGLLGLDVQAALGMELDMRNGQIRFVDCAP